MSFERAADHQAFKGRITGLTRISLLVFALLFLAGCDDMKDQPKYEPLEENSFFPDHRSARPLPAGTVPRSAKGVEETEDYPSRDENGELVDSFPFPITEQILQRGRESYDDFCSPCHGLDGYGQGMIVQRGFSPPPSLHDDRLRQASAGYFYEVITNGFGQMYSYDSRIQPSDRWAIVAYIRALQLSQHATAQDVPEDELQNLQGANP
jgi:mono/diheme cytochrome c family protein